MNSKCREYPLLVYLDQNKWIDLAKIQYGSDKTDEGNRLLETIYGAVRDNKVLFPLSIVHLDEINKISSETKRQQLAALMVKLSKGYSLSPYVENHIAVEVDQIIASKLGYPHIDLRRVFLKQGIHQLIGTKVDIVSRNGNKNKKPPRNVKEKMLCLLFDPSAFELSLTKRLSNPSLRQYQKEAATKMDDARKKLLIIKDNDLRKRTYLFQNVLSIIVPHIIELLKDRGLSKDFFKIDEWNREDVDRFLIHVPTGLTFITLSMYMDLKFQKAIEVNDIADIWGLTLAIPYCDVVVTEKRWVAIAKQAKLDRVCDTIMLSSINDLKEYL